MFAKIKFFLSILTLFFGVAAFSDEARVPTGGTQVRAIDKQVLPSINEKWYTLWGFGFSNVTYEDDVQSDIDTIRADSDRTTINMDLLGFYWPDRSYKTMYGVVLNGATDTFRHQEVIFGTLPVETTFTISQYTLAFSAHHFFGANIGDGWFVRGDVGPSWFEVTANVLGESRSFQSDYGLGLIVGGGYSFILGEGTRMPLGFYLAHRSAEGESAVTANFNVGLLF